MEVNPKFTGKAKRDYKLVLKAKAGDEMAFTMLFNIYKDPIYFMILKKLRNPVDAEDVTIEAFGKAFNNISQYKQIYAFSTWLFRIAYNNYIDYLRGKKYPFISLDDYFYEENIDTKFNVESNTLNPEEKLIKNQKSDILDKIIQKLQPEYSTIIKYRYYKGMSYKEISQKMHIPMGTVKVRLYRSHRLLFAILYQDIKKI